MSRLIAVLLAGLCASAAMAGPHDHRSTSTVTVIPGVNVVVVNRDADRFHRDDRRHAYRDDHRRACPPGLARKHNGCMPPGQAKKHGRDRDRDRDHDRYSYRDDHRRGHDRDRVARW